MKTTCTACGLDCSHAYGTHKGDPYHFGCLPAPLAHAFDYRRGPSSGRSQMGAGVLAGPAIVMIDPKYPHNVGAVVRLAACYGIGEVWCSGRRVRSLLDDPESRLPREERMRDYADVLLAFTERPLDLFRRATPIIGVEYGMGESLATFQHPRHAVYVLGPEDGGIPAGIRTRCWRFVHIPTRHCLNVAAAAATVMWDRTLKGETA